MDLSLDKYFAIMRAYLGDQVFERNRCLVKQEKSGWTYRDISGHKTVRPVGVEGSGHHGLEFIFPSHSDYDNLKVSGGQASIPTHWRHKLACPYQKSRPDIHGYAERNFFFLVLLRYPPSSLVSSMARFSKCNRNTPSGKTELEVAQDSVATLDGLMRFPYNCNRVLFIPQEAITQYPMAFLGPFIAVSTVFRICVGLCATNKSSSVDF